MATVRARGPWDALGWMVTAAASFAVILLIVASLDWPIEHDLPIMLYDGWLVFESGRAPYREIFEMNPPGVFLVYGLINAITQGRDPLVRVVDVTTMIALTAVTVLALRRHGVRVGILASCAFLVGYLKLGAPNALQREYLVLLPFAMSLYLALEAPVRHSWRHQFVLGALMMLAASVKPSLALGWLVMSAGLMARACVEPRPGFRRAREVRGAAGLFVCGASVVGLALLGFLALKGALADFISVVTEYWPLYAQLDGHARVTAAETGGVPAVRLVLSTFATIVRVPLAPAAGGALLLALYMARRDTVIEVCVFAGLLFAAAAHVPLSNKYWEYHNIPAFYVAVVIVVVTLSQVLRQLTLTSKLHVLLAVGFVAAGGFAVYENWWRLSWSEHSETRAAVKGGDVSAIEGYLRDHLRPGDQVLPLDVTGGAVHAMYRAQAPLSGRFLYSFHFYHAVSAPIIQRLRDEMADLMERHPPRLVVQFPGEWRPTGPDTARDFPELDSALASRYFVAVESRRFRILQRIGD